MSFTLITAHPPANVTALHPQPGIWPEAAIAAQAATLNVAELDDTNRLEMRGRHIYPGAQIFVDGELVDGSVSCMNGELPNCVDEQIEVVLSEAPSHGGFFQIQLQNPLGKFTNDSFYFSEQVEPSLREGSILASRGDLMDCGLPSSSWEFTSLMVRLVASVPPERSSPVLIPPASQSPGACRYSTGCPFTRIEPIRPVSRQGVLDKRIYTYLDRGADVISCWVRIKSLPQMLLLIGKPFANLTVDRTDITSRLAFDLAESPGTVELANITLIEGDNCEG